jgi:hypothetical protein
VLQGQTLTAANDLTDNDGIGTITYLWKADGVNIAGATNATLTLTQAQVGKKISVTANYTDAFGAAETVESFVSYPVINTNDAPTGAVIIAGEATQGHRKWAGTRNSFPSSSESLVSRYEDGFGLTTIWVPGHTIHLPIFLMTWAF